MVRLLTTVGLIAAGLATIYSSPIRRQTVAAVEADIANIASQVSALDTSLNALSDSNPDLQAALNINTASGALDTALKTAVTDVNSDLAANGPPSVADANTIISAVLAFEPTILDALKVIVAKKPTFAKLPIDVTPLVLGDLTSLYGDTQLFEAALLSAAPAALCATGTSLASSINIAFSTAIVAYGGTASTVVYSACPAGSGGARKRTGIIGVPKAAKRNAEPAEDTRAYLKRSSK